MLNLIDDCFRFVTGYFDIISASSPHIYHSALALAPRKSTVRKLYESHAQPFMRIVHGLPMSWDTNTATTTRLSAIELAVWSPCNRFIAITCHGTTAVDVLDPITLQRVQTLESPQDTSTWHRAVIFSPDSRILTCFSGCSVGCRHQCRELSVVSWDLQTGSVSSVIRWEGPPRESQGNPSTAYSVNGEMVAVFCRYLGGPGANIFIFDIASGIHVHSHSLDNPTPLADGICTYGEFLQFATRSTTTITIWEVGFTSGTTPMKVETLTIPDNDEGVHGAPRPFHFRSSLRLLPAPRRLVLISADAVQVWDGRGSERLLHHRDFTFEEMTFSSGGHFFACSFGSDVYLWKESPTLFALHAVLASSTDDPSPLLSPNGESIVVFGDRTIRLWRTKSLITPPSSTPTQAPRRAGDFILDFSPDLTLAVVLAQDGKTFMVLNLESGVPQLTIDTSMEVRGLRVIGNSVVVIGDRAVITWNLPAGDCVPDARVGLRDSSRTINLGGWRYLSVGGASISPDSRHIAIISGQSLQSLSIHNASTGEHLGQTSIDGTTPGTTVWFSPDGCDVWCVRDSSEARRVRRVSGGQKTLEVLESEWRTVDVEGYPWRSSHGYQVTTDWWILGPDRKRLLMLPPPFQSHAVHRVWKGRFLALLHSALSEPVILELDP